MESNIQDLVMHTSIVKEMWNYLDELYLGKNNFIELLILFLRCSEVRRATKPCLKYYVDFNKVSEELNVLLLISHDVKKMQKYCVQLAMYTFLESLPSDYFLSYLHVVASSAVDSLLETY